MQDKEMVIRSFKKCGITTNIEGSENNKVNIRGLEGYIMPLPEEEYHLRHLTICSKKSEGSKTCFVCKKIFSRSTHLHRHIQSHASGTNKKLKCPNCNVVLYTTTSTTNIF